MIRRNTFSRTRRCALAVGLAVVATLLPACGSESTENTANAASEELTKIKLALKIKPGGVSTPLVVAQQQGYFREEGLDVEFVIAGSPNDTPKLIAAGEAQIAAVDAMDALFARSQGLPIVSIATLLQHGEIGIVAPSELNITSPKQLEGRTVGVTGQPGQTNLFKSVMRNHGVDLSKIQTVELGITGAQAMAVGRVSLLADATNWTQPVLYNTALGKAPGDLTTTTFLNYEDWGAPRVYIGGYAMAKDYLDANPDIARKFLRAFSRSTEWSISHPAEGIDILLKAYPELNRAHVTEQFRRTSVLMVSTETQAHGIGWQDPGVWETLEKYFRSEGITKTEVKISDVMTNEYLPKRNN